MILLSIVHLPLFFVAAASGDQITGVARAARSGTDESTTTMHAWVPCRHPRAMEQKTQTRQLEDHVGMHSTAVLLHVHVRCAPLDRRACDCGCMGLAVWEDVDKHAPILDLATRSTRRSSDRILIHNKILCVHYFSGKANSFTISFLFVHLCAAFGGRGARGTCRNRPNLFGQVPEEERDYCISLSETSALPSA
jgi:hypothetical protein